MGKQLCDAYPALIGHYFDRADEILDFPISQFCFEGPEEELVKTENQQPAIFLVSMATDAILREQGIEPAAVAGHSLGEYSALVAAQALDFEQGLRLTRRRGEMMAEIADRTGGIMAAVLGLPPEQVEEVCREASSQGVVEIANYNSPAQTVISGEEQPVTRAMELAKERGADRVIQLNVSAPFHCSLMAPLATAFEPVLAQATMQNARMPVIANVDARYEESVTEIEKNLVIQLASPVRWTASMQRLLDDGYGPFVEVGPGRVLSGLMKSIDPNAETHSTSDLKRLEAAIAELG
jgi:[acyl-carrier-protein] S-malonyltransferase